MYNNLKLIILMKIVNVDISNHGDEYCWTYIRKHTLVEHSILADLPLYISLK